MNEVVSLTLLPGERLTIRAAARRAGCDPSLVRWHVKQGNLAQGADGRVDWGELSSSSLGSRPRKRSSADPEAVTAARILLRKVASSLDLDPDTFLGKARSPAMAEGRLAGCYALWRAGFHASAIASAFGVSLSAAEHRLRHAKAVLADEHPDWLDAVEGVLALPEAALPQAKKPTAESVFAGKVPLRLERILLAYARCRLDFVPHRRGCDCLRGMAHFRGDGPLSRRLMRLLEDAGLRGPAGILRTDSCLMGS